MKFTCFAASVLSAMLASASMVNAIDLMHAQDDNEDSFSQA